MNKNGTKHSLRALCVGNMGVHASAIATVIAILVATIAFSSTASAQTGSPFPRRQPLGALKEKGGVQGPQTVQQKLEKLSDGGFTLSFQDNEVQRTHEHYQLMELVFAYAAGQVPIVSEGGTQERPISDEHREQARRYLWNFHEVATLRSRDEKFLTSQQTAGGKKVPVEKVKEAIGLEIKTMEAVMAKLSIQLPPKLSSADGSKKPIARSTPPPALKVVGPGTRAESSYRPN